MASLSYDEIFNDFLGNITDYDFASFELNESYEIMTEYLHKTLSQTYIRRLFSSIEFDDDIQQLSFDMKESVEEYSDIDFVRYILSNGMVIEWLKPLVRNKSNIQQFFAGKEQNFYAQSSHLTSMRNLYDDVKLEVRKSIRDRGYIYNSYLGDV